MSRSDGWNWDMYEMAQRPDEESSKKSSQKIKLKLGFDDLIEAIE